MAGFSVTPTSFDSSTAVSDWSTANATSTLPSNSSLPPCEFTWACIPAEVAFVVMASVGSLVVFLLASILALACQVCRLQRRQHTGRHTRSNVDLVSGTGYWGAAPRAEGGGIVGPCDASVMLEEVKAQEQGGEEGSEFEEEEEEERRSEVVVTEDSRAQGGISVAPVGELVAIGEGDTLLPPPPPPMPGSQSRDSCLEMGKDLEDMPLVV